MISFNTGVHMNVIFQHFLFFKLHDARWIGNFIKITTKETWSTSDYFILLPFFFILFLCVNESSMEDLLGLCKKQMDDMVNFNFSTHKWETASKLKSGLHFSKNLYTYSLETVWVSWTYFLFDFRTLYANVLRTTLSTYRTLSLISKQLYINTF